MNKYEEAKRYTIDYVNNIIEMEAIILEALDKAQKHDELMTAKKPIRNRHKEIYTCANCGEIIYKEQKYCDECGQAILQDWSE